MVHYWLLLIFCAPSKSQDSIHETMSVIYKDMRVHVVDRDGNPVKGLSLDDFILLQAGVSQTATFFEEVDLTQDTIEPSGDTSDAVVPLKETSKSMDRYLVLFVDSSHLNLGGFRAVKQTAIEFIDTQKRDRDFVKVVQFDRQLKQHSGFIQDRETLKQVIESMPFEGRLRKDLLRTQRSINKLITDWYELETPDGKISLEMNINQLIQEKGRVKADSFNSFYHHMLAMGHMLDHIDGSKSIFLFTGGGYLESNAKFGNTTLDSDRLGRVMNRADATIYTMLFASTETLGGSGFNLKGEDPGLAQRLKSYSTFPPTDQYTEPAGNTIVENNRQLESAPGAAAENSGGLYLKVHNTNNSSRQLARLNNVAGHFYRLGFVVEDPKQHLDVKIKLKQSGLKLLYGDSFEPETAYTELSRQEQGVAHKAMLLYANSFRMDLDNTWSYELLKRKAGGFRIPVSGVIKTKNAPKSGYELGFAALGANREMLDLTTMRIKEPPLEKSSFQYYDLLLTTEKPSHIRASIRDLDTGALSFLQMEVTETVKSGPHIPTIMLSDGNTPKALGLNQVRMLANKDEKGTHPIDAARQTEDPFNMGDFFFNKAVKPYEFTPGVLYFMFHVQEPDARSGEIQFLVKGEDFINVPGRIGKKHRDQNHSLHVQGVLNTSKLKPSHYTLYVRVIYQDQKPIMTSTSFEIQRKTRLAKRNRSRSR